MQHGATISAIAELLLEFY